MLNAAVNSSLHCSRQLISSYNSACTRTLCSSNSCTACDILWGNTWRVLELLLNNWIHHMTSDTFTIVYFFFFVTTIVYIQRLIARHFLIIRGSSLIATITSVIRTPAKSHYNYSGCMWVQKRNYLILP